jgi:hypothetical protein
MKDHGFASAEIGRAPLFTLTTVCKPGCNPTLGHSWDCTMRSPGSVFFVPSGPVFPSAPPDPHCPHCGGKITVH